MVGCHTVTNRFFISYSKNIIKVLDLSVHEAVVCLYGQNTFVKIQNPIKFEDFMAKRLFEYCFTETLNFSVFFVKHVHFDPIS